MTVPGLIHQVLNRVWHDHYQSPAGALVGAVSPRFFRDRRALTKAIARYGYECEQRGWEFDAEAICRDLLALLAQVRASGVPEGAYLPVYLEGAVDRHVRLRAEELSAAAKDTTARNVARIIDRVTVAEVRRQSDTETLAVLYRDLAKRRPRAKPPRGRQAELRI